jgi:hypothetical protein
VDELKIALHSMNSVVLRKGNPSSKDQERALHSHDRISNRDEYKLRSAWPMCLVRVREQPFKVFKLKLSFDSSLAGRSMEIWTAIRAVLYALSKLKQCRYGVVSGIFF